MVKFQFILLFLVLASFYGKRVKHKAKRTSDRLSLKRAKITTKTDAYKFLDKGRVPKWHVFGPKNYDLRHPYSESALNSEYNSVSGILKI